MNPVTRTMMRTGRAAIGALMLAALVPAIAFAHPLGNFTINHYAGIRVAVDAVTLDVVIDMAEIPAFQERQRIDANGDGEVADGELEAERLAACGRLAGSLELRANRSVLPLEAHAAGLSFPPGQGGLPTMRLVCEYRAPLTEALAAGLAGPTELRFEDRSWPERIGWREIVVQGDGVEVTGSDLPASSVTNRLTSYPQDLLVQPLDVRVGAFKASRGGAALAPLAVADAEALPAAGRPASIPAVDGSAPTDPSAGPRTAPLAGAGSSSATLPTVPEVPAVGAVPGGVREEISRLIEVKDLSPLAILGSLAVAVLLGAVHAASPGHGKTVMAAYLVGSRGSARHAVALGMTVTISHTLGVLGLAAVTVFASSVIPPERLYPVLSVVSGAIVVAIGLWLLYGRYRIWAAGRLDGYGYEQEHEHGHNDGHGHDHGHTHALENGHDHALEHGHDHALEHGHEQSALPGEHSHGGRRHSHLPPAGTTLSWRSLFSLGLAGGLVPSTSALLLLLGSLAANRPAYGLVLVVAFGAGMAIVLGGIGLALVYAGRLVSRMPSRRRLRRAWEVLPVATALVVVAAGLFITSGAVSQVF